MMLMAKILLISFDLVVEGVDNFATRFLLNRLCISAKVPLVSAAVGALTGNSRPLGRSTILARCRVIAVLCLKSRRVTNRSIVPKRVCLARSPAWWAPWRRWK